MVKFAIAEDNRNKVVSALADLEVRSTIRRLRAGGHLSADDANLARQALLAEIRRMIEQPISPLVLDAASALIERHMLRAPDAIQLGTAIVAREMLGAAEMRFIASDKALLEAAGYEGFETWNPAG